VLSEIGKRTEETLLKHLQAFGSGDVDALMADYDEAAVLIMPDGPLHGTAEIRSGFESLLAEDLPPGSTLDVSKQIVEGEIAYIVWSGESEKLKIPFATDTFVVRDGKIVAQTFAAQMETKPST
jgi:ketosteroid isomerase-like protein